MWFDGAKSEAEVARYRAVSDNSRNRSFQEEQSVKENLLLDAASLPGGDRVMLALSCAGAVQTLVKLQRCVARSTAVVGELPGRFARVRIACRCRVRTAGCPLVLTGRS